jgi:hypothetical protein
VSPSCYRREKLRIGRLVLLRNCGLTDNSERLVVSGSRCCVLNAEGDRRALGAIRRSRGVEIDVISFTMAVVNVRSKSIVIDGLPSGDGLTGGRAPHYVSSRVWLRHLSTHPGSAGTSQRMAPTGPVDRDSRSSHFRLPRNCGTSWTRPGIGVCWLMPRRRPGHTSRTSSPDRLNAN